MPGHPLHSRREAAGTEGPVHLLVHAQRLTTSVRRLHIWSEIGGEPPELLDLPDDETQATLAGRLSTFASEDVTSLTQTYWNTFFAFIGTGPAIQAAREAEDSEALAAALALERALRQLTGVRGAPTLLDLPSFTAITATQPSGLPPNVGDLGDAALRELFDAWADLRGTEQQRDETASDAVRLVSDASQRKTRRRYWHRRDV